MFDKKVQAEALMLDDEGSGHLVDTDFHGVYLLRQAPPLRARLH
jgi:hypothetical protein